VLRHLVTSSSRHRRRRARADELVGRPRTALELPGDGQQRRPARADPRPL